MGASDRRETTDGNDALSDGPVVAFLHVLASTPDGAAVGAALARGLLAAWAPDQVAAYLLDPAGSALVAAVHFGFDADQLRLYSRVPLDVAVPVTEVFRSGEDGSWRMADAPGEFPAVAGWVAEHPARDTAEVIGLPIRSAGQIVGVLVVSFPRRVDRSWRLRVLLDAGVNALALWSRGLGAMAPRGAPSAAPRGVQLSLRQRRVLDGVRAGSTNPQIAADLKVSVGTVKTDLAHLFRVFGVSHRHALVEVVDRAGI